MRYEGKARRSQKRHKSLVDRVWTFFSSVKVAIVLIAITLLASIIGTIFPQERNISAVDVEAWYKQEYGVWGEIYYNLGLGDLYSSWWYVLLVFLIGTSLVICSLDRIIPLYKALKYQRVKKDVGFIDKQRVAGKRDIANEDGGALLDKLALKLSERRYNVRREGNALLAEKGRISRWGPYINHIGLIIFLIGMLMRLLPGWYLDEMTWVVEGETNKLRGTEYYLKNNGFKVEYYDPEEAGQQKIEKKFETKAVLYEKDLASGKMTEVAEKAINVNDPLQYNGVNIYQALYQEQALTAMTLAVTDKKTGEAVGEIDIDLRDPDTMYELPGGVKIEALRYYPSFALEETTGVDGEVKTRAATRSRDPDQPGLQFKITSPKVPDGEEIWVIAGGNLDEQFKDNRYKLKLSNIEFAYSSGLQVRIDKALPIVLVGAVIFLIGVVMGFHWQHRRVWVNIKDDMLYFGAHTNKNWYGLKNDVRPAAEAADIHIGDDAKS